MNALLHPHRLATLLLSAALLAAAPQQPPSAPLPGLSEPQEDDAYQGEAAERYAMVRTLEGSVRIRKGDLDEDLTRGTPIGEGDVVESRGRGVLQLGEGTRIAFGGGTRFTVGALFTDRKGERQVLFQLTQGRLRVQLGGESNSQFRIDTPSGTVTCRGRGTFSVEADPDRVVRLKVLSGRVSFSNERDEAMVGAGQRLTVFTPQDGLAGRVRAFNTFGGDDFDRWSERAMTVTRGESWERVPAEIRHYADDLDANGRWVQSDEFGWVWQPRGVDEDWRPYYRGRWAAYDGGMTWISDEPWAYVAYHHGRWHWGAGVGWFWIPGIYYSPAWVAWHHTPGYYGWAPLGYYNAPCHWGHRAWGGGVAWNVVAVGHINLFQINLHMHRDVAVFRTFNGGRDLHAPWQRTPLIVTRAEFRNPGQMQAAFRRDVHRERLVAYERHAQVTTGRVIVRRELRPDVRPEVRPGGPPQGPRQTPFEERRRPELAPRERPMEARPAKAPERRPEGITPRERPMESRPSKLEERRPEGITPRERPVESRPSKLEERRPEGITPRERPVESRPSQGPERRPEVVIPKERPMEPRPSKAEERRPEGTTPRERPAETRPNPAERRPDAVTPRERPVEPRPSKAEERRPEGTTPRERPVETRPSREERRPDPAPKAEVKPQPAPKPEAPKEKPKEERH